MKTLLIALLIPFCCLSQSIWLTVGQDGRLAFDNDDSHGNSAFTLDAHVALELRLYQKDKNTYFYFMRPEFEYADLAGGKYMRYGASMGITFNRWMKTDNWLENFDFTATAGGGILERFDVSGMHAVATLQLGYNVTDWLILYMEGEFMQRRDLSNTTIGYSTRAGIKIKLKKYK